ncbi:MAG: cyclase family protein [Oscillospiraceae bacterium]|nr:cyclase family protein [Oscillospiraceae bacterium]
MKVVDLTHTVCEDMPVYPGTQPPRLAVANTYETDGFKETLVQLYSHTGTHVDPPAHIYAGRTMLDQFPPQQFIGRALVIDCTALGEGESITMEQLRPYGEKVEEADFLLFYTGWDSCWGTDAYFGDYPCIDDEVLDHILAGDYKGIGFDVIGLDPIAGGNLTRHKKLFREKDILNIENLNHLGLCGRDLFWFGCFPLKLENCDGAPVRAMAWWEE